MQVIVSNLVFEIRGWYVNLMKKYTRPYYSMSLLVVLTLSGLLQAAPANDTARVSVMTYNVENLFDTKHDDGKSDYTFLPLTVKDKSKKQKKYCETIKVPKWKDECFNLDWSESNLKSKMKNTAAAILQVNDGKGPDVLILQEIENKRVLTELVRTYLSGANYTSILLIEGNDIRGIDTAIVTRLPVVGEPILHEVPFVQISGEELKDTRGILEAELELPNQEKLFVYANHFPAPFHKREYRIQALQLPFFAHEK
jgi:hypothetical protein